MHGTAVGRKVLHTTKGKDAHNPASFDNGSCMVSGRRAMTWSMDVSICDKNAYRTAGDGTGPMLTDPGTRHYTRDAWL
jgi:hypothetical protein